MNGPTDGVSPSPVLHYWIGPMDGLGRPPTMHNSNCAVEGSWLSPVSNDSSRPNQVAERLLNVQVIGMVQQRVFRPTQVLDSANGPIKSLGRTPALGSSDDATEGASISPISNDSWSDRGVGTFTDCPRSVCNRRHQLCSIHKLFEYQVWIRRWVQTRACRIREA